jgi:hypothetical protein
MSADQDTTIALTKLTAEVSSGLQNMEANQTRLIQDVSDVRKEGTVGRDMLHQNISQLVQGFTDYKEIKASESERLNNHIKEDNKRFSLVWKAIFTGGALCISAILAIKLG